MRCLFLFLSLLFPAAAIAADAAADQSAAIASLNQEVQELRAQNEKLSARLDAFDSTIVTLAYGPAISWNMKASNARITLTGNATLAAPTNYTVGQPYTLQITQGGSGSYSITAWPSSFNWGAAGTPILTTTVGKTDLITLICVNSAPTFYAAIARGF